MENKITLDLIIPQYYGETVCEKLFTSINNQIGVDFNSIHIIIVNDCNLKGRLSTNFIKRYKNLINISLISNDRNSGPGITRQTGIDFGTGAYITCIDEDDYLYDGCVLYRFVEAINRTGKDIYHSYMVSEGKSVEPCNIWIHGKVFKRTFLKENNIRFSPNVRVGEDIYFNLLCDAIARREDIEKLNFNSYVWVKNPNSITRVRSKEFLLQSYEAYFISMTDLMEQFESRSLLKNALELFVLVMYKAYYFSNLDIDTFYYKLGIKRFLDFWKKHKHYYNAASEEMKQKWHNLAFTEAKNQGLIKTKISFNNFINSIDNGKYI